MRAALRPVAVCALAASLALPAADRARAGSNVLTTVGDVLQFGVPAAGVLVAVGHGDGTGLWMLGATSLVTAGVTHGLKFATNNTSWGRRPNGGDHSFPSGHTSAAFAGAAFLHYRYGWQWGFPAIALASVVAYSRVEAKQHHVRDVIAGAAIGYAVGYIFTDHFNDKVLLLPYVDWSRKPTFGIIAGARF
jgi:membrane-associated phospholipid phosphatase